MLVGNYLNMCYRPHFVKALTIIPHEISSQVVFNNRLFSTSIHVPINFSLGLSSTYEVCSESNAPAEITSIRIILEARLFQVFLRPVLCRFVRIICSGLHTAERQRRNRFYCWFGRPPPSYSWERPGTVRGLPASTSPLWNRKRSAVAVFGK